MKVKSLKHNFIMYSTRMFSTIFFGLIIFPYVARTLGAQNLGKIQFIASIVSYFILLINLGIPSYGKREIAYIREDKEKRSILVLELLSILGITTIIVIILYFLSFNFIPYFIPYRKLFIINIAYLILNMFNVDWFYQGIENQEYITKRDVVLKIISGILIFYFIKEKTDYLIYSGILVISLVGTNILNFKKLLTYIDCNKEIIKKISLKKHLKSILILFTTSLATTVFSSVDSIMVRTIINEEALGYYSLANRIGRMPMMITLSIFIVFYPRLCNLVKNQEIEKYYKLRNNSLDLSLLLAIPSTVGIFVLAPEIIILMGGNQFKPSINILRMFSLIIVTMTYAYFTGQNLIVNKKEKIYMNGQLIASILNVIFNFISIPLLGSIGAALGTVLAEVVAIVYRLRKGKKIFLNFKILDKNKMKIVISSIVMGISLVSVRIDNIKIYQELILKILLGGFIYIILLIIQKEKNVFEKIRRKND